MAKVLDQNYRPIAAAISTYRAMRQASLDGDTRREAGCRYLVCRLLTQLSEQDGMEVTMADIALLSAGRRDAKATGGAK